MIDHDDWGSLSQDDAESHQYIGACIYHGNPQSIRKLMLGKRLRKSLKKVEKQVAPMEHQGAA